MHEQAPPGEDFIFGIPMDANAVIEEKYGDAPVWEILKLSVF